MGVCVCLFTDGAVPPVSLCVALCSFVPPLNMLRLPCRAHGVCPRRAAPAARVCGRAQRGGKLHRRARLPRACGRAAGPLGEGRTLAALLTSSMVFSLIIRAISSCRCLSSSYLLSPPSPEASGSGGGANGLPPPALVANAARGTQEVARVAAARARGLKALCSISASLAC